MNMRQIIRTPEVAAFGHYLRTGQQMSALEFGLSIEAKFNPYHDPTDGRFTFGPGGHGALRRRAARPTAQVQRGPGSRFGIGGNSRAFNDPMTLEPLFPGLANAPGGALVALGDNLLDLSGPGRELSTAISKLKVDALVSEIKTVDPSFKLQSFGFPETFDGQMNLINDLRMERARLITLSREIPDPCKQKRHFFFKDRLIKLMRKQQSVWPQANSTFGCPQ